jgi:hypothetical protein
MWRGTSEIELPANAATNTAGAFSLATSLACTSQGDCITVGVYTNHQGNIAPMVATETHGAWGRATALSMPASAVAGELKSVACTGPGSCVASGYYNDTRGYEHVMVASETRGVWGRAQSVALPPNAIRPGVLKNGVPMTENTAVSFSVACASTANCEAVGTYQTIKDNTQSLIATDTRGVWAPARELRLPSNANRGANGPVALLVAVTWTSGGQYVAVGGYTDNTNSFQAMVADSPTAYQP